MPDEQAVPTADNQTPPTPASEPITAQPSTDEPYDLDLDLLLPVTKKVQLNGKIYDVHPPKVKDIANLARVAGQLQNSTSETVEGKVQEMLSIFENIMPGLKDDSVDLSMEQLMALFGFVNQMASPSDNSALKQMGVEPTAEKKNYTRLIKAYVYFLRKFPGYTADLLFDEYALRFYSFLEISFKLDAQDTIEKTMIASLPHMENGDRQQVIGEYERASYDIIEDVRASTQGADINKLKEELN